MRRDLRNFPAESTRSKRNESSGNRSNFPPKNDRAKSVNRVIEQSTDFLPSVSAKIADGKSSIEIIAR